ncbi:efflux RND transporter periplasmic adaptor subunit [Bowmanella denitrificans]|uniref:Efflux RND transporter periplasmic adaptor subunit n=1 Tax=Bowmanella denitrificans TaxID=366582 RepID=A0ABP3GNB1_9ALTE
MKKFLILAAILGGLGALVAYKHLAGNSGQVTVEAAEVSKGVLSDTILASGNLVFKSQIQIRSEVTGRVQDVLVEEGQQVKQGDVLMRLDPTAFEADVDSYQAAVQARSIEIQRTRAVEDDLNRQVQRNKQLLGQNLVQQETVDALQSQLDIARINTQAAQAQLEQAQAALLLAKDRLRKTVFIAAMDGLLASVDIKPGETVIAGTTNIVGSDLMVLADPSAILAELRVDEADIARIALNQQAEIFAAALPKTPINGEVISIGTSAKRLSSSEGLAFRVKVLLNPGEHQLYPGMSCRAEIVTAQGEPTLNVPVAAIQEEDGKSFVWQVSDDNTVNKVWVTTGMATDIHQAVLTGLSELQKVVIGPSRLISQLEPGQQVQLKQDSSSDAS